MAVPQKQPFTQYITKQAKYLRKTHEEAHFHQNCRHRACSFNGN